MVKWETTTSRTMSMSTTSKTVDVAVLGFGTAEVIDLLSMPVLLMTVWMAEFPRFSYMIASATFFWSCHR